MHEFVQQYAYQWKQISKQPSLPVEVMREYAKRLDWEAVSEYRPFTEELIEEFEDCIDWNSLCRYQPITDRVIEKYHCKLPWSIVVVRQNLSDYIIREFWNYIEPYRKVAERYQAFDEGWMKDYGLSYPEDRMDCWAKERKWDRLESFSYTCERDLGVVYAYKSTQKDGYSILNRKVRYDVGSWSRDWHCDGNIDVAYSFGLSCGSKHTAIHFYPRGSLFLVEIPIDELYCVTEEGVIRARAMKPIAQVK